MADAIDIENLGSATPPQQKAPVAQANTSPDIESLGTDKPPVNVENLGQPASNWDQVKHYLAILDGTISATEEEKKSAEQGFIDARAKDLAENNIAARTARKIQETSWSGIGNGIWNGVKSVGQFFDNRLGFTPEGRAASDKMMAEAKEESKKPILTQIGDQAKSGLAIAGGVLSGVGKATAGLAANLGYGAAEEIEAAGGNLADYITGDVSGQTPNSSHRGAAFAELQRIKANKAIEGAIQSAAKATNPEVFNAAENVGGVLAMPELPGAGAVAKSSKVLGDVLEKSANFATGTAIQTAPKVASVLGGIATLKGAAAAPFKWAGSAGLSALGYSREALLNPEGSGGLMNLFRSGSQAIKQTLFEVPKAVGEAYKTAPLGKSMINSVVDGAEDILDKQRQIVREAAQARDTAKTAYELAVDTAKETGEEVITPAKELRAAQDAYNKANFDAHAVKRGLEVAKWMQSHGLNGAVTREVADGLSSAVHGAAIGGVLAGATETPGEEGGLNNGISNGILLGGILHILGRASLAEGARGNKALQSESSTESPLRAAANKEATNTFEIKPNPKELGIDIQDHAQSYGKAVLDQARNSIASESEGMPGLLEQPKPLESPAIAPETKPPAQEPLTPVDIGKRDKNVSSGEGKHTDAEEKMLKQWKETLSPIPTAKPQELNWAPPVQIKDAMPKPEDIPTYREAQILSKNHIPVESSKIESYAYDPQSQRLSMLFKRPYRGDYHYIYTEVPQEDLTDWLKSKSLGSAHNKLMRLDYPYIRIKDDFFGKKSGE